MNYYYIHTISYFIGNNRQDNIQYCIDNLNKIKYSKKNNGTEKILFIICCIYDELTKDIENTFNRFKNLQSDIINHGSENVENYISNLGSSSIKIQQFLASL